MREVVEDEALSVGCWVPVSSAAAAAADGGCA